MSHAEGFEANAPLHFEGLGLCFYRVGAWRVPEAGEFYLSGAIVQGYRAPNRLGNPFRIATPTHRAKRIESYEKGVAL